MAKPYLDWLGQEIKVGSPILYAISSSHYAQVVWAEVLEIIDVAPQQKQIRDPESRGIIDYEDYWPYDRTFKLKVQPYYENTDVWGTNNWAARSIESDYSGGTLAYARVLPKPAFIQNVEKVTVFPLPDGVRERFEAQLTARVETINKRVKR